MGRAGLRLRTAGAADLDELRAFFAGLDRPPPAARLRTAIADGCLLLARADGALAGCTLLDLAGARHDLTRVAPRLRRHGLGRTLVVAAERRAVQFGLLSLTVQPRPREAGFWRACGYRPDARGRMRLAFARRQTAYGARIAALAGELGLPADYGRRHRMPLQPEARTLQAIGPDLHGRERFLAPGAAAAWQAMRAAAAAEGVELLLASAYRSVDYQAGIIRRKRERGLSWDEILWVSAAPGFSEHHTGRAVDVAAVGCEPLEPGFEDTGAYAWLAEHAPAHGFRLSYPSGNRHRIAFEPWHWYWTGS